MSDTERALVTALEALHGAHLRGVTIAPTDVIVVEVPRALSGTERAAVRAALGAVWASNRIVVLEAGIRLRTGA